MNDILLDTNGDLSFQNGDLKTGYSDNLHQEHILIANKGEYREFPEIGVAIEQIINDDDYMSVLIDAKKNLEYDGMKINNIKIDENGNIDIDGSYK
jgi:hypothetical protein